MENRKSFYGTLPSCVRYGRDFTVLLVVPVPY